MVEQQSVWMLVLLPLLMIPVRTGHTAEKTLLEFPGEGDLGETVTRITVINV